MPSCLYLGGCHEGSLLLLLLLGVALVPDLPLLVLSRLLLLLLCEPLLLLLPASRPAENCRWPTSLTPGGGLPL